jgi:hypothetical protein
VDHLPDKQGDFPDKHACLSPIMLKKRNVNQPEKKTIESHRFISPKILAYNFVGPK